MANRGHENEVSVVLPAELDPSTAVRAHGELLLALDAAEGSDAVAVVDLAPSEGAVTPLALQLVLSARRSFPEARLRFGPNATAALAAVAQS